MRYVMATMLLMGLSLGLAACADNGNSTTKNHPVASP